MTLTQVALASGLHYTRISQIETGLAVPHRDALALARAYRCEVASLFDAPTEEEAVSDGGR